MARLIGILLLMFLNAKSNSLVTVTASDDAGGSVTDKFNIRCPLRALVLALPHQRQRLWSPEGYQWSR
ncbi:MAG: hypothetical protein GDA56_22300 [Hormoscilla sp. GM7CHS1pb]|nr:hypothetical protein [Hormoscilla sp. GM7CHS1pb]